MTDSDAQKLMIQPGIAVRRESSHTRQAARKIGLKIPSPPVVKIEQEETDIA